MSDPVFTAPAVWYDGVSALRHEGTARWSPPATLILEQHGVVAVEISLADLRFAEMMADRRIFTRASEPDFRLRLPRDLPAGLAHHLPAPQVYGGWIDRIGLGRAAIALGLASAAAVALFMTAPQWLGPMIPFSWEQKLGDAMVGDLGNRLCSTPEGDAALDKLLREVAPGDMPIRAGIANIDMVNAVALPGGRVLLFDGIVQQAESADELAGVLAHEVGHVRQRHVMTALVRQFGLSILLSGANTGAADMAFGLASMGYTREAEREADAEGRKALAKSDISPLGAARFFERMAVEDDDVEASDGESVAGWFASHPSSSQRARDYRGDAKKGHTYPEVLTAQEFKALKAACKADKDVEEFGFF